MGLIKTTVLSTKETCFGAKRLGQIISLPTGRIDKISIYLEPTITDITTSALVIVEIYEMDSFGFPTGMPLASDSIQLANLTVPGYVNFRAQTPTSTAAIAILSVSGGDKDNFVSWRFATASSGGEELLLSTDSGTLWTQDPTRKLSYIAYSAIEDAVNTDNQYATIQGGTLQVILDVDESFSATGVVLDRMVVTETDDDRYDYDYDYVDPINGDTVALDFSDFVITLVVDQSGSMTWNDNDGIRFDFLKDLIDDLGASLPVESTVNYSILKFYGRKIGKIDIFVEGSDKKGFDFEGVKIIRKSNGAPSDSSDGLTIYEGIGEHFKDTDLTPGTKYYYGIYSINSASLLSRVVFETAFGNSTIKPPMGIANFSATANTILSGDDDLGVREILLKWNNPVGFDYNHITLVRNTDRFPISILDGETILESTQTALTYTDSSLLTDVTYYYKIFTTNTHGIKCQTINARQVSRTTQELNRAWETTEAQTAPVGLDTTHPSTPEALFVPGNAEIQIELTPAGDTVDSARYKIWFRTDGFPQDVGGNGRDYDGDLIFSSLGTSFVHRRLDNGESYFYVIVAIDAVGNVSDPLFVKSKPISTSIASIPAELPLNFEAEVLDETVARLSWKNPIDKTETISLFFEESARVLSTVDFIDDGSIDTFVSFEFKELARNIIEFPESVALGLPPIDPKSAIILSNAPSFGKDSISATVEMTNDITLLNRIDTARIQLQSILSVKNRNTGVVLSNIKSRTVTVELHNPFSLAIKNEPEQSVSRRSWVILEDGGNGCKEYDYKITSLPGIYVGTPEPFRALIEASFNGEALTETATVTLKFLDPKTRSITKFVTLPGGASVFDIIPEVDEILDRNGVPTGDSKIRTLVRLDIPPSNVPGDFIIAATADYRNYSRTAEITVHFEPTLNIDLELRPFSPDGVDVAEQKAFVYFGAFNGPQELKLPVEDYTITSWSIRPLCLKPKNRPLYGGDVTGLGVKSYTKGGLAQNVFWGPATNTDPIEEFEVHVKVQVGGMKADGYGMLVIGRDSIPNINRILLRNPTNFSTDIIYADGDHESTWEVVAKPEEEMSDNTTQGGYFVNAVVSYGGLVPSLPDGRIVSLRTRSVVVPDSTGNPSKNSVIGLKVINNVLIKTNLTGPNGATGIVNAKVEDGKAIFKIRVNAKIPPPDDNVTESEFIENRIYHIQFEKPKTGVVFALEATTIVEKDGKAIVFKGGGSNLTLDAPPAFLGLVEPLNPT